MGSETRVYPPIPWFCYESQDPAPIPYSFETETLEWALNLPLDHEFQALNYRFGWLN